MSAFVISVRGNWFLVTAGHVLGVLANRQKNGRRVIRSFLMDKGREAIPFDLVRTQKWHVDKDGMDYALIPLRDAFVAPLKTGNVVPLDECSFADITVPADQYFVLGFPDGAIKIQAIQLERTVHVTTQMGTPLLPIQRVDSPPAFMDCKWPRFYAEVPEHRFNGGKSNGVPKSIVCMSGGPVFAFKQTSPTSGKYWLIAVQSSWHKKSRTLAACPILPLIRVLEQLIDDEATVVRRQNTEA